MLGFGSNLRPLLTGRRIVNVKKKIWLVSVLQSILNSYLEPHICVHHFQLLRKLRKLQDLLDIRTALSVSTHVLGMLIYFFRYLICFLTSLFKWQVCRRAKLTYSAVAYPRFHNKKWLGVFPPPWMLVHCR